MFWSLLAFLAICAGHAELWIAAVNRVYALPIPVRWLHRFRLTHDIAILAFPILIYWRVGLAAPLQFFRGEWSGFSPLWVALFCASSLGFGGLCIGIMTWWRRTQACVQQGSLVSLVSLPHGPAKEAFVSQSLDERRQTRVVSKSARRLVHLPFNQQFQLETTEKQLVPPNWPVELDGLSILHLSDWHLCKMFSRQFYETATAAAAMVRADLIAFTGDLTDDIDCLDWLPSTLGSLTAPLGAWFILGNHDAVIDHAEIRRRMVAAGWNDLGGKRTTLDVGPASIVIGGDETPWLNSVPQWSDSDRQLPRVLLAHTPDRFPHHCGEGVDLILAGHTHGGQIVLPVVGPVYAPSLYGCRYPSGVFSYWTTVMHVSRGLAGMHPLRFGARPEITRLVIRSPKCISSQKAGLRARTKVSEA